MTVDPHSDPWTNIWFERKSKLVKLSVLDKGEIISVHEFDSVAKAFEFINSIDN